MAEVRTRPGPAASVVFQYVRTAEARSAAAHDAPRRRMAKASEWLRGRRDFCEAAFSFLIEDFGYRRRMRRFQDDGGFQIGYLGPGAGVLVA